MSNYVRPDKTNVTDRIAWRLCQILDDDAPLRWERYRFAAKCIAENEGLMSDLKALRQTNGER